MNKYVIAVPLYKTELDDKEYKSLRQLFDILGNHDIVAYCPNSLDLTYYINNFKFKEYYEFWDEYFQNYPIGYNKLMLQPGFYETFKDWEYMLVYQPDCWVFRDELDYWCNKGYDYIGAPFLFTRNNDYKLKLSTIGNGGFSLRKISSWIELCTENSELCEYIWSLGDPEYGEDHIFIALTMYGKNKYKLPSFEEAANFAFDTDPYILYIVNGYKKPFGCHAFNKIEGKDFYTNINIYKDKKLYSVVTYLFGNYDILRDPDEIDPSAEYICITDRTDLKSDVWEFKNLIGWDLSKYNDWQKTLIARYTALNYINTGICIKIDASVHIKKSLSFIPDIIDSANNIESYYLIHPWRDNYLKEYDEWINYRNLDHNQKDTFIKYCTEHNYDYNSKGMLMTTIMIQLNNERNKYVDSYVLNELMNIDNFNVRVDQTYFSIIFANMFAQYIPIKFLSMQVLESEYLEYYYHNKNYTHDGEYKFDKDVIDFKYYAGNKWPCKYFINC